MKVSKAFLSDYIDISDISYKELAEKMVFAGNEYEEISKMSEATNLVIGYVTKCERHPESTKLSICLVDIGEEHPIQIVCGAPNVRAGMKVIVAKVGATLPGNMVITNAKLAGVESSGMICSLLELGIDPKFVSEEGKTGIHILNDDAPIGVDAVSYMGYDDEVISFELTANRSDLLSMLGMAYEVGALYDREVTLPETTISQTKENLTEVLSVNVQTDDCKLYSAKMVKNVVIKESPYFIQNRLIASGIRPINNVVDISNYVMLEYGQPLHFFDAEKLGNQITVRKAKPNEELVTLDGMTRVLDETIMVIADCNNPVALAGVMGGESTQVDENTKHIIIESAVFAPLSVRESAKRFLRSESSKRFEKGIDSNRTVEALKRACYLLSVYADGEVLTGEVISSTIIENEKEISVSLQKINTILGMDLTEEDVLSVFAKLKFKATVANGIFTVFAPTRRMDIIIPEDLIEEVGRIIGYHHVVGVLPKLSVKTGKYTEKGKLIKDIRNRMYAIGLDGVLTYSLVSEKESMMFLEKETERITLQDPMSEDKKHMRRTLIPSHLQVHHYHISRNMPDLSIFEIGSGYFVENGNYVEEAKISGLVSGSYLQNEWQKMNVKADFYTVKGIVEHVLTFLGLNNRYAFDASKTLPDFHPGRSAAVLVDRKIVGYLGQVHPKHSKKEVYVFELNLDALLQIKVRNIKYKEIPRFPTIIKDLAFVIPKELESSALYETIKKAGGRLLVDTHVFDVYTGEHLEAGKKSVAYRLTFQDSSRTLTDTEITEVIDRIVEKAKTLHQAEIR